MSGTLAFRRLTQRIWNYRSEQYLCLGQGPWSPYWATRKEANDTDTYNFLHIRMPLYYASGIWHCCWRRPGETSPHFRSWLGWSKAPLPCEEHASFGNWLMSSTNLNSIHFRIYKLPSVMAGILRFISVTIVAGVTHLQQRLAVLLLLPPAHTSSMLECGKLYDVSTWQRVDVDRHWPPWGRIYARHVPVALPHHCSCSISFLSSLQVLPSPA